MNGAQSKPTDAMVEAAILKWFEPYRGGWAGPDASLTTERRKQQMRCALEAAAALSPSPQVQDTTKADFVEREATLFAAIKHGDEDHQRWLRDAIDAHFAHQPVPKPYGSGNKEKRITELTSALTAKDAEIAELRKALEPFAERK